MNAVTASAAALPQTVATPQPILVPGKITGAAPSTLHEALMGGGAALGGDVLNPTDIAPDIAGINAPVPIGAAATGAAIIAAGGTAPAATAGTTGTGTTGASGAPDVAGGGGAQAMQGAALANSDAIVATLKQLVETVTQLIAALAAQPAAGSTSPGAADTDASATDSQSTGGGDSDAAHACGMADCTHDHELDDPAHQRDGVA